jgi:hypothetical protein
MHTDTEPKMESEPDKMVVIHAPIGLNPKAARLSNGLQLVI